MTAVVLAIVATAWLIVDGGLSRVEDSRDAVAERLQPASVDSRALLVAVVNQETGQRGYVLTGEDDFLEPYRTGRTDYLRAMERLRTEAGGSTLSTQLDAVDRAARTWRQVGAQPEIDAVRAGQRLRAVRLVASGEGKAAFDELRGEISTLQELIDARVTQEQRDDQDDFFLLRRAMVGSALLSALVVAVGAVLARAWVLVPVGALRARMRAVSRGDLEDEVLVDGPPEVVAISRDAENMRRRILAEVDALRGATEALAQQSPVVAALSAELAPAPGALSTSLDVDGLVQSAEGVLAGDSWEAVCRPDGTLVVVVTDVSGHGAEAGLLAFGFRQRLDALLATDLPVEEVFTLAARWTSSDQERFLSCLLLELDGHGHARWINAGHPAGLVVSKGDRALRARLDPTGPLVSSVTSGWSVRSVDLEPEDLVILCTDGVVDARAAGGREFEEQGVVDAVAHPAMDCGGGGPRRPRGRTAPRHRRPA